MATRRVIEKLPFEDVLKDDTMSSLYSIMQKELGILKSSLPLLVMKLRTPLEKIKCEELVNMTKDIVSKKIGWIDRTLTSSSSSNSINEKV